MRARKTADAMRFGHLSRRSEVTGIKIKRYECELFKQQPYIIYSGFLKDGELCPDLCARYEQWFEGDAPSTVLAAFYSACLKIYYVVQSDAVVAKGEDDAAFAEICLPLPSPFFYEEYDGEKYRVILRNPSRGRILTESASEDFTPTVALSAGVRHHHRLFGIDADDPLVIRWSGAQSSLDWEDEINSSGYVRLGGALGSATGLISFGSAVVILRERGLTSMTALGAPENFKIKDYALPSALITANTAAVCGDGVYFHTAAGIMRFDGNDVAAVDALFQDKITAPVCAAGVGGKYLLGCGDNIYCYDAGSGCGYFIDCPAECLLNGNTLLAFGNGGVNIIDAAQKSLRWQSGEINFGSAGRKTVTGLYFECAGNAEAIISNGVTSRSLTGTGGYYRVGLSGQSFTITINADEKISGAVLYAEACDGI